MKNARTKFGALEQSAQKALLSGIPKRSFEDSMRRGSAKRLGNAIPGHDNSAGAVARGIKISSGWSFTLCLLIVLVVAGFASIYAATGVNSPWYNYVKPTITPPAYVFSIVWVVLYFLLALSMYLSLTTTQGRHKKIVAFLFALNLFFNGVWSFLFFGLQNTGAAFFDLVFLFITTLAIMTTMAEANKNVSWLLLPYALWLIFAGVLNYLVLALQMM